MINLAIENTIKLFTFTSFIVICISIISCFGSVEEDPLSETVFKEIGCNGTYKRNIFSTLNQVCEDCHNLFREAVVYNICRQDCFISDHFVSCLQTLKMDSKPEIVAYKNMIKQLYGTNGEL